MRVVPLLLIACVAAPLRAQAPEAPLTPEQVAEPWLLPEPEDNAFDDYEKAFGLMQEAVAAAAMLDEGRHRVAPATDVLAANVDAFAALAEALPKDCLIPGAASFNTPFPYLAQSRNMARLLALKGIEHELNGEFAFAFAAYCDGIAMGQDMARGGVIIHRLVGYAITAIMCKQIRLAAVGGQAPPEALREFLRRLTELESLELPLAHTYAEELKWSAGAIRELFRDAGAMDQFRQDTGAAAGLVAINLQGELTALADAYARFIRLADEPYRNTLGLLPTEDDYENTTPMVKLILPAVDKLQENRSRMESVFRATCLVVALELYRQVEGDVPEALDALVPDYVNELPIDPYGVGPFVYRAGPLAGDYVLYSVGQDLSDDGGSSDTDLVYGPLHDVD